MQLKQYQFYKSKRLIKEFNFVYTFKLVQELVDVSRALIMGLSISELVDVSRALIMGLSISELVDVSRALIMGLSISDYLGLIFLVASILVQLQHLKYVTNNNINDNSCHHDDNNYYNYCNYCFVKNHAASIHRDHVLLPVSSIVKPMLDCAKLKCS